MDGLNLCIKIFKTMLFVWITLLVGASITVIGGVSVTLADVMCLGGTIVLSAVYTFISLKISIRRKKHWEKFLEQFETKENGYASSESGLLLAAYFLAVGTGIVLMIYYIGDNIILWV